MQHLLRALSVCAVSLLLHGCVSMSSEFDYTRGDGATAQVVVPEPVRILGVDGKVVSLPQLLEFPYTVTMSAGASKLYFQYGESWGEGQKSELRRGPIMEVSFDARAGESYTLDFIRPESVDNLNRAEEYLSSYTAWLTDSLGQRIDAESTGSRGGFRINLGSGAESVVSPNDPSPTVTTEETATLTQSSRLDTLKQLWLNADEDEKKEFMQWVVSPDS